MLIINNVFLYDPSSGTEKECSLLIRKGRFEKISPEPFPSEAASGKTGADSSAVRVIDAKGLCAAPGFIDTHSHFRDPGYTWKEDLHTGGWKDIFRHALSHTLEVLLFLFLTTFILNLLMELAGRELIGRLLLQNSLLQPAVAALIGLIPNCAASVILTELYLDGVISFGAAVSGLSAGAGLGLLVLWRGHPDRQEALRITELLYLTAVVSGTVLMLVLPF